MIPKPDGGERPLGIPTIRDRVVQTAAKLVLDPIFKADLDPAARGYRPKRGGGQAIQAVLDLLRQGYTDVVDADLSKYFDTIPHPELMGSIARRIVDANMLRSLCRRVSSAKSGLSLVFSGSSPITSPRSLRKRTRSQGPSLHRRYPASAGTTTLSNSRTDRHLAVPLKSLPSSRTGLPRLRVTCLDVLCPLPRWTGPGASVGCFPKPCCLPRTLGGSASMTSLSRPAQALHTLRPVNSLNRQKRPLSQGFGPAGYPAKPRASYRANRPLPGWDFHPRGVRAVRGAPEVTEIVILPRIALQVVAKSENTCAAPWLYLCKALGALP